LCELAASVGHEVPAALACLRQVPDSTRWMQRLLDHPHGPTRSHANSLASAAPARPRHDVEIVTFGELIVRRSDGEPISDRVRGGRVQQLLAQLVLDEAPTRVALAAKLWPELTPKQAGTNLRVTLASLLDLIEPDRRQGGSWFVRSIDGRLRLVDEGVTIDVRRFDDHIRAARDAERTGMPSLALEHHRSAFEIYAGEFLPGIDDADVDNERLRLQTLAYHAGCRLGELLLAKGEPEAALRDVVNAARIDPISERAWRIEIRCHLALGSTSAARSTARRLRSILADERLSPDRETELLLAKVDPHASG
jgi:DNA-binding SARP family transcriptional activator